MFGLIYLQILLSLGAAAAGAICALVVWLATLGVLHGRRRALSTAFLFPFLVIFYLEAGAFAYGIAEYALGRDSFVDGIYHYPLTNGYQLVIFDKFPEAASIGQSSHPQAQGVDAVRSVQVVGNLILVTAFNGPAITDLGHGEAANRYLTLDTRSGSVTDHPTLEALRLEAAKEGAFLDLMTTDEVLSKAKSPGWRGLIFATLLLVPPVLLGVRLIKKLRRLRRSQTLGHQFSPNIHE